MFHHPYRLLVVAALVLLLISCQFGARDATPTVGPVVVQTGTATAAATAATMYSSALAGCPLLIKAQPSVSLTRELIGFRR